MRTQTLPRKYAFVGVAAVCLVTAAGIAGLPWFVQAATAALAITLVIGYAFHVRGRIEELAAFAAEIAEVAPGEGAVTSGYDELDQVATHLTRLNRFLGSQLADTRGEQSKFRAVLAGMAEGVIVIDRAEVVRLANDRAAQLFGVADSGVLLGAPVVNASRDPNLQVALREALTSEEHAPVVREVTIRTADREETLHMTATAIAGVDDGRPLFVLVFHDVTELKKLEATRRDFVANVSHEIRTPLTAIRGYAETLRQGGLEDHEQAERFLSVIERNAERLGRLTDDLLTLSDLELGRTPLRKLPVDIAETVGHALDVVREKAAAGGVELRCEIGEGLPKVEADADRLLQVFVNLLDNAVKYSESGGSVVARITRGMSGGSESVELAIVDSGIGIPSRDLPRLTERFYRVDKARSRELGGTGLGLAIVKHIVQAHGGQLRIESVLGVGTTVYISLPTAA